MTISHNFEAGNKTSNQLAGGQAINETLEMFKHFFFSFNLHMERIEEETHQ